MVPNGGKCCSCCAVAVSFVSQKQALTSCGGQFIYIVCFLTSSFFSLFFFCV